MFGEEEEIRGYEGLEINIWLCSRTYHAWLESKYTKRLPGADDFDKTLREWFSEGLASSRREFEAAVYSSPIPDFGSLGTQILNTRQGDGSRLRVQHFKLNEAPEEVKKLHLRMQPLLIFEIDGTCHSWSGARVCARCKVFSYTCRKGIFTTTYHAACGDSSQALGKS